MKQFIKKNVMVKVVIYAFLCSAFFILIVSCTKSAGGTTDTISPTIVQTIPPDNSAGIDPATLIALFFDDAIDPSSINDSSVQVTQQSNQQPVSVNFQTVQSQAGNTILIIVPDQPLPEDDSIIVMLPNVNGITDDGGNGLASSFEFSFQTGILSTAAVPLSDLGFEAGTAGFIFSGDGAIVPGAVDLDIVPTEGTKMAAISTGEDFDAGGVVSGPSGSPALNYTTSFLTTGPITASGASTLYFDYDFVSAEFNEFVGDIFDDIFLVAVWGPNGIRTGVVTSVNLIGTVNPVPITLPSSFTTADDTLEDAGRKGWTTKSIDISTLGMPIRISFSVSDVGDSAYTSIVFIDNISAPD